MTYRPKRIQRRRTKGWTTPLCGCGKGAPHKAIYVGRGTKYGNPHWIEHETTYSPHGWYVRVDCDGYHWPSWEGPFHTRREALAHAARMYAEECSECRWHDYDLAELRGHDLMCWCPPDQPCHADALLRAANQETP